MEKDYHNHYVDGHELLRKKLGDRYKDLLPILSGMDDYGSKKERKNIKKYGAPSRETWAFDSTLAAFLYEHIKMFEAVTITDIDNTDEYFMYDIPTWESYLKWSDDTDYKFDVSHVTLRQALDIVADSCLNYLTDSEYDYDTTIEYFQYGLHVLAEVIYAFGW